MTELNTSSCLIVLSQMLLIEDSKKKKRKKIVDEIINDHESKELLDIWCPGKHKQYLNSATLFILISGKK